MHKIKSIFSILFFIFMAMYAQAAEKGEVVNISYVKAPFNLQSIVMKRNGILEKELEPLGVKPVWHEIISGARQAQAMAAGSLDIGGVMNTTSIQMAKGEGNPIKIIAGVSRPVDVFAIVASKKSYDNGLKSIKDLKGKIVAGPKGTVLHQILAAALAKNDMTMSDIQFIQMDIPKAFAALESGRVDAALLAANTIIKAEESGGHVLTTANGLVTPKLAMAASERFINEHPDRLKAVLTAHDKAAQWIREHHAEAIALGAEEQGIDIPTAEKLFVNSHFTQKFNDSDIASMSEDLNFMLDNGMMRNKVEAKDIIMPQSLEQ